MTSSDDRWVEVDMSDPNRGRYDPVRAKAARERALRGETPHDPDCGPPTTREDVEATLADPENRRIMELLRRRRA